MMDVKEPDPWRESDPWVHLLGPDSAPAKEFFGSSCPAVILLEHKHVLPWSLGSEAPGPKLSLEVYGGHIAPRLVLRLKVAGSNLRKVSEIKAEFFPGIAGQLEGIFLTPLAIDAVPKILQSDDKPEGRESKQNDNIPRRSQVVNGDGGSRKKRDPRIENGKADLQDHDLPQNCESQKSLKSDFVKVTVYTEGGINTGLDITLPEYDSVTKETQWAISEIGRAISCSFDVIIKSNTYFENKLKKLKDRLQTYKARAPWWPYMSSTGNPMCTFSAMVARETVEDCSNGLIRFPAQNSFATSTEAYIVLSYGIFLEHRQKRCQLLRKYRDQEINENVDDFVKYQLKALDLAFGPSNATLDDLWMAVFLNQRVSALPISDPLGGRLGLSEDDIARADEAIGKAFEWNESQRRAINVCSRSLRGRLGIIAGPPGTGRTTTLAGLACLYKALGVAVILFAPTTSTARSLAGKAHQIYRKAFHSTPRDDIYLFVPGRDAHTGLKEGFAPRDPQAAPLMITTPESVCYPDIFTSIQKGSRNIVIMFDDAYHIFETEMLATLFAVGDTAKVIGMICVMDMKEWYMYVSTQTDPRRQAREGKANSQFYQFLNFFHYSKDEDGGYPTNLKGFSVRGDHRFVYGKNEFANQIGLSLPARLLRQGFQPAVLLEQERFTAKLAEFPFNRSYKGLQPPPIFAYRDRVDAPTILDSVYRWLGVEAKDFPVLFIKVPKSKCFKARYQTESKKNEPNAAMIADLLTSIYHDNADIMKSVALITPYSDQCRLYNTMVLPKLAAELRVHRYQLPKATTVESMRGFEAKYVIYDLVVTSGDSSHGLGIVMDNYLAHLASTRASEAFIIVGSHDLLEIFPRFWGCLNLFNGTPNRPLPYIAQYVEKLAEKGLDVFAPERETHLYGYEAPECYYKQVDAQEVDGIWERGYAREEGVY